MVNTESAVADPEERPDWRYYLQEKVLVIFFLGFSAGLPLPLVYATLTAWLYDAGMPTSTISMFAYLMLAYSFKFVWSPLVDAVSLPLLTRWLGRRRAWLLLSQIGLAGTIFPAFPGRSIGRSDNIYCDRGVRCHFVSDARHCAGCLQDRNCRRGNAGGTGCLLPIRLPGSHCRLVAPVRCISRISYRGRSPTL